MHRQDLKTIRSSPLGLDGKRFRMKGRAPPTFIRRTGFPQWKVRLSMRYHPNAFKFDQSVEWTAVPNPSEPYDPYAHDSGFFPDELPNYDYEPQNNDE